MTHHTSKTSFIDGIIAYENGELDHEQIVELFQDLVDTGIAWQLQGSYGRTAQSLIDAGLVVDHYQEHGGEEG